MSGLNRRTALFSAFAAVGVFGASRASAAIEPLEATLGTIRQKLAKRRNGGPYTHRAAKHKSAQKMDPFPDNIRRQMRDLAIYITERPNNRDFIFDIKPGITFTIKAGAIQTVETQPGEDWVTYQDKQIKADKAIERLMKRYALLLLANYEQDKDQRGEYADELAKLVDPAVDYDENGNKKKFAELMDDARNKPGLLNLTTWEERLIKVAVGPDGKVAIDTWYMHDNGHKDNPRHATTVVNNGKIEKHHGKNVALDEISPTSIERLRRDLTVPVP